MDTNTFELENLVAKLSSLDSITDVDSLWNDVTHLPKMSSRCLSRGQEENLDQVLGPLLKQFITKNCSSANLFLLVQLCIEKCEDLQKISISELGTEAPNVSSLLLVLRLICRHFLERMPVEALQRHLTMCKHFPEDESQSQTDKRQKGDYNSAPRMAIDAGTDAKLCKALVSIICKVPLSNCTITLHSEAVSMLLVLLGSKMYSDRSADENPFYINLIFKSSQSEANILTKRLLQNYLCPIASEGEITTSASSFDLASKLLQSFSPFAEVNNEVSKFNCTKQFCDKSLLLVEILTNHCTQVTGSPDHSKIEQYNPFRVAISSFVDFSLSASTNLDQSNLTSGQSSASFSISFEMLYLRICEYLEDDQATLLLYMLLHKNSAFLNYVLTRTDIDKLLLPILKVLYSPKDASSHHLYMILIILLILSEDTILNNVISETMLPQVSWFSERVLTDISLASLMVGVLLRTIQINVTQMKDKYLHTNCLATLANMSNHFQNLNPYCAQRLLALSSHLVKKQTKLNVKLGKNLSDEATENAFRTELAVVEEILRLLLEIINNALTNQLLHNSALVHCLVYDKHILDAIRLNHNYQDIVYNLDVVVNFYLGKLKQSSQPLSLSNCDSVLQFIKKSSKVFPFSHLHKFPELKFRYCEEEEPEDFFIPYVWSIAYRNCAIFWNIDFVTLFKFAL